MVVNPLKKLFGHVGSWNKNDSVVGVDIGSSFIKVVQIKKKDGKAVLETYGEIALGPYADLEIGQSTALAPDKISEALKDLFRESGVTTKNAALSIPLKSSLLSVIKVPRLDSEKEINEMVPIEARKYIPVPISEVSLDWWIIPKNESKRSGSEDASEAEGDKEKEGKKSAMGQKKETMEVMVVAIHNETVSNYQEIVRMVGLTGVFFELEIFSAIRSTLGHGMSGVLLVDIGSSSTKLVIVEYGVARFSHIINKGSQNVSTTISKSMSVSFARAEEMKKKLGIDAVKESKFSPDVIDLSIESVFSETNSTLLEYQRRYNSSIGKTILTGGGSLLKGLPEIANKNIDTEIIFGDPFSKIEAPAFLETILKEAGPEFSVAVGIALRKLQEVN